MHFRDLHEFGFVGTEARCRDGDPIVAFPRIRALRHILREMKRRFSLLLDRRADGGDILSFSIALIRLRTRRLGEMGPAHAIRRNAARAEEQQSSVRADGYAFVDDRAGVAGLVLVRSRDLRAIADEPERDLVIGVQRSDRAARRADLHRFRFDLERRIGKVERSTLTDRDNAEPLRVDVGLIGVDTLAVAGADRDVAVRGATRRELGGAADRPVQRLARRNVSFLCNVGSRSIRRDRRHERQRHESW